MAATRRRPTAFTLVELVVAIGILVLMMTMAGTVFSLTLRSTGQAKALTNLSERLRMYERTMQEDLRAVRPGSSMMALECRQVWVHWTGTQRDLHPLPDEPYGAEFPGGGDPERMVWDDDEKEMRPELPRADVLTFFTAREAAGMINPSLRSSLQLVSYGHVKPGDLSSGGAWIRDPDDYFNIEAHYVDAVPRPWTLAPDRALPLTANQWMLGRRQVLVMNTNPGAAYARTAMSDPDLFDGIADVVVSQPEEVGGSFDYDAMVVNFPNIVQARAGMPVEWRRRARLDLTPPPTLAARMGAWFLPNCASFKVEWALSTPQTASILQEHQEVIWVDSASSDTMRKVESELQTIINRYDPDEPEDRAKADALTGLWFDFSERFIQNYGDPDKRISWVSIDPRLGSPGEPDPFFPTALRITLDLYDDMGRLDRPIRHVMVVPVGPG